MRTPTVRRRKRLVNLDFVTPEVRTLLNQLASEATKITDRETREVWMDAISTFRSTGEIQPVIDACMWRRKVVPLDEFLFGSAYMNIDKSTMFPKVYEALEALDTGLYQEAVLTGGIGTGKTTIANFRIARDLYRISCMASPQLQFGLTAQSSIIFTVQSVRLNTAKKAIFDELGNYINKSPYFNKVYPYDKNIQSSMIFREQNITIMPVTSKVSGAISMNVIGGILDEVNFMQRIEQSKSSDADEKGAYDQAKSLYNTIARRRKSRFLRNGKLPGTMMIVSSSRYPDDFTQVKMRESTMYGGNDPTIYVYNYAQWEAKAEDAFSSEKFRVQVGDHANRSKVLVADEQPSPGCKVIEVPMDFWNDFDKDVDGSLRDFAGQTVVSTSPFFAKREKIYEAFQLAEKYEYENATIHWEYDLSNGIPRFNPNSLRLDVHQPRGAHIDLGLTKDACGITVGHIAGMKIGYAKDDETGETTMSVLPIIGIDLCLRIRPPKNGEIDFSDIRQILINLRDKYKIPLKWVTFDGFNSVDSRQILRKHGFIVDYQSVEKIEPYRSLRDVIYDGRLILPKNEFVAKELSELEVIVKNNKEKIDHKPDGSKDVADSLCGTVALLVQRRAAWQNSLVGRGPGFHLFGNRLRADDDPVDDTVGRVIIEQPVPVRKVIPRRNIERRSMERR